MLEENLKRKGDRRSEIAKVDINLSAIRINLKVSDHKLTQTAQVLSDVRALESKTHLANRGKDPLLLKKDKIHGVVNK